MGQSEIYEILKDGKFHTAKELSKRTGIGIASIMRNIHRMEAVENIELKVEVEGRKWYYLIHLI